MERKCSCRAVFLGRNGVDPCGSLYTDREFALGAGFGAEGKELGGSGEHGAGVPAEVAEGVEGAAPEDSALPEGDDEGAQERVGEEGGAHGEESGVPGGDAVRSAEEAVEGGDAADRDEGWRAGGAVEEGEGWADADDQEPGAGEDEEDDAEAEDGEEVFGHDVDDAESSWRPMDADHVGGEGDALTEAGELDAASEGEVFEDLHGDGVEAAESVEGRGADEVEGADADRVAGAGVGDAPGTGGPEGEKGEEAEEHPFAAGAGDGCGEGDEVVGALGLGEGERSADRVGGEEDVGVGEEEPVRVAGVPDGGRHGVGLAEPAWGEVMDVEGGELGRVGGGERVEDLAGAVGGAVVDGDDVEVGVVLPEQRGEAGADRGLFVAGGDDDGERGIASGRAVVLG